MNDDSKEPKLKLDEGDIFLLKHFFSLLYEIYERNKEEKRPLPELIESARVPAKEQERL